MVFFMRKFIWSSLKDLKVLIPPWFKSLTRPYMTLNNPIDSGLRGFKLSYFCQALKPASVIIPFLPIFFQGNIIYILVYVDDIIIKGSSSSLLHTFTTKLNAIFSLKHLGDLDYFLGIKVKQSAYNSLLLTQTNMLKDIYAVTPMHSLCKLTRTRFSTMIDPFVYMFVVGALQYATITTHDISYSVNKVCQFMAYPLETRWVVVKRILRYLKGTLRHGLRLSPLSVISSPSL